MSTSTTKIETIINITLSKICNSLGYSTDALLYLIKEIRNNKVLIDLCKRNEQKFIENISDVRFIEMLYSRYINDLKKAEIENSSSSYPSNPSNPNQYPSNPNNFVYSPSQSDNNTMVYDELIDSEISSDDPHILPNLSDIFLIDHNLSLNFIDDLAIDDISLIREGMYKLGFDQYGQISKIELNSILFPLNDYLKTLPYIYLKIEELGGKVYDSKRNEYYGKIILKMTTETNMMYISDNNSCVQVFTNPRKLDKLTLSFYDNKSNLINLQQIFLSEIANDKNKLNIKCEHKHYLKENDEIILSVIDKNQIIMNEINVKKIDNDYLFIVDNTIRNLTENTEIYKKYLNGSVSFKFSELNYKLISNRDKENIHLIQLNNIIEKYKKHNF